MEITKHLFFNLSLLMIFMVICLVWSLKREASFFSKPLTVMCGFAAIWVCISFSYELTEMTLFDLREMPVVIGGLYMGIGGILSFFVILIRALHGMDSGFYLSVLLYVPMGYILWRLHPWFWNQNAKSRVAISVGLTFIISLLKVSVLMIDNYPVDRFDAFFAFLVVPPLGMGITTLSLEFVRSNIHMRQRLYQSEKITAVEQMGAAISHEIRNPLTVSKGFVQLLEDDSLPREKQKEYLFLIKDGLDSAERVIQDYLTFSKPNIEVMEVLDLESELTQIINILKPTANQHSVHFSTKLIPAVFIKGDRHKFKQCMLNLLKNGIEAMSGGGYLTITTKVVDQDVEITISDTGVGMSKQQVNRLGEPYYSTKGAKGTGLGTMVSYSIVRAMKGTIRAESEPGKGTSFFVNLPVYPVNMIMDSQMRHSSEQKIL